LSKTDAKKKEISKDVSSFANSDGGNIIYGVKEFGVSDKKHLPEKVEDGFDPSTISKEWLEQVITSNIHPKISGLIIKSISTGIDSKVIYVVIIPKSATAHQAGDKRYYKRYNFASVMMEDYEIKDVMNRGKIPIVEPIFSQRYLENYQNDKHGHELHVRLVNKGKVVIKHFQLEISLPKELVLYETGHCHHENFCEAVKGLLGKNKIVETIKYSYRNSLDSIVIFSEQEFVLMPSSGKFECKLVYRHFEAIEQYLLGWRIYADEMPYKEGSERLFYMPR